MYCNYRIAATLCALKQGSVRVYNYNALHEGDNYYYIIIIFMVPSLVSANEDAHQYNGDRDDDDDDDETARPKSLYKEIKMVFEFNFQSCCVDP